MALALANATAYSGIVIDPVVITFAFLVWLPHMQQRRALYCVAWLTAAWTIFFVMLMTASHSWAGLIYTVINRHVSDQQSILLVISDSWGYSGLIIGLAAIGAVTAFAVESRQRVGLFALLGFAAFMVPVAQIHDQTTFSLDKHLAYGIWFATIAAGYGCSRLLQWIPGNKEQVAVVCTVIALAYPTVGNWESAWQRYHGWPNAHSFVTSFRPVASLSHGLIYASEQNHIAEYYTPQGDEWTRWTTKLSLDPVTVPSSDWRGYYLTQLRTGNYGVIALFYSTTFASTKLPPDILRSRGNRTYKELLNLVGENSGQPGLYTLTLALQQDSQYKLAVRGPYDSAHNNGIYVIWRKVQT